MDNNKMTINKSPTTIMKFEYPIQLRLFSYLLGCMFLCVSLAVLVGLLEPLFNEDSRLLFLGISEVDVRERVFVERYTRYLLQDGLFIFPLIALCSTSFAFSLFPTIEVKDEGIKVSTLFGLLSSKWLAWSAITKLYKLPFLPDFYVLGMRNVGILYYPIGLMLWAGRGGIPLMSSLSNQPNLITCLYDKRPDLFKNRSVWG